MNGEGSQLSICTAKSCGDGMAIVRGKVGSGSVSCGEGGICRSMWWAIASSMISTAVSSTAVILGDVG